ncbi:GNAT family N-acetyltransferase [Terriglobus saanensis]|uniref:GCN5-related N-acetyltransferase n=1 Tax=Terriglobus saanensis (strain ATCC BAA-1853 / DSM 23119 / SP1PR4) TaxID=401053 RepID=E8UYX3_TERSS|nr:GNAT family N-acetyltransferase [Terriglobus saanensis]ADV84339.1 GCN5-related N-acetyltransferase [Terriglobus saanensis SP1PR4]
MDVKMREFMDGDEAAFRELNEAWIKKMFAMEAKDEATFADPRKKILEPGGRILLAEADGAVVGCCALVAMGPDEYEVAKMSVAEDLRGAGIGRKVLQGIIDLARRIGAKRLYLESSSKLKNAVHLYEALGFQHLPPERIVPSPYARADVYMEMAL